MAAAAVFTQIYGGFEGSAAMGGATIGATVGMIGGFGLSLWSVLRQGGHHAGTALACIGITALIVMGGEAYVIVS